MKFESKYLLKSISKKYRSKFVFSLFAGPFLTTGLWAIYIGRNLDHSGRRVIGKVIEGIKVMPDSEMIIKRLIVFLEFDHESELLKIKTRRITKNRIEDVKIKYSKLRVQTTTKIYDGISIETFKGIEFLNNGRYVGYLLTNHFTWTENQLNDCLAQPLRTIKTNRYEKYSTSTT